jgi:hypothetical protein
MLLLLAYVLEDSNLRGHQKTFLKRKGKFFENFFEKKKETFFCFHFFCLAVRLLYVYPCVEMLKRD